MRLEIEFERHSQCNVAAYKIDTYECACACACACALRSALPLVWCFRGLQCVAVWCGVCHRSQHFDGMWRVCISYHLPLSLRTHHPLSLRTGLSAVGPVLQRVSTCCSVLQHVPACSSVFQHVAACCSVVQCGAEVTMSRHHIRYFSESCISISIDDGLEMIHHLSMSHDSFH